MVHTFMHSRSFLEYHTQFPVGDPGKGPAPLIFTPNFFFSETEVPSPYLRIWKSGAPLSQGLDLALIPDQNKTVHSPLYFRKIIEIESFALRATHLA